MSNSDSFGRGNASASIDAFFTSERSVDSNPIRYRIASDQIPSGFEIIANDTLVRVSKQDFWKIGQDGDGFFIERLVDDAEGPVNC